MRQPTPNQQPTPFYRYLLVIVCMVAQLLLQPALLLAAPTSEIVTTTAVAAPLLIGPIDGAVTTGQSNPPVGMPKLAWSPVVGADRYNVELSSSVGFADKIKDASSITYGTTFTPMVTLADGTYYWRVQAGVGNNDWGEYSEVRSFTKDWGNGGTLIPQLISPENGSERAAFTHDDFAWQGLAGAAQYRLEISTSLNFSNFMYTANTIQPRHTPTERLPNNLYYWRVIPIDASGNFGTPSVAWTFNFNWKYAPELLTPSDNVDLSFLPRFSWTAVESAEKYELQISTQPDFGSATSYQTYNTEYTPEEALGNDQDYYWRVKGIDKNGYGTPWSTIRQFRMRWNFETEQLAPVNTVIQQSNPFFAWTPIPGAEQYRVQVDETNSFEKPLMDENFYNVTTAAIVKIEDPLIYIDRNYFWRVQGIDAQGNTTPWSAMDSFRYGYISSPNLIYPLPYYEPDATNTPVHSDRTIAWPLFVWDAGVGYDTQSGKVVAPHYYELTVAADRSFSDIRFSVKTTGSHATPTADNPFTPISDGQIYYWRVRAFFANGDQLGVDQVWTTRIDRRVAERPLSNTITPIFPADATETVTVPPLLGWLPVDGANNYHVQISKDRAFTQIVDETLPQFVNYAPWQGRQSLMPAGTYFWRVRAESAPNVAAGDWSEPRYFNLSTYLIVGNRYDTAVHIPAYPNSILMTPDGLNNPTYIASSANVVQDDYRLTDLHIALNDMDLRSSEYPKDGGNYDWIFAFGVEPTISAPVRYMLYIDNDHIAGSGGTVDPLGKPILVDSMYRPEYVVVVERTDNTISTNEVTIYQWIGNSWLPATTLTSLGGDAWYSDAENAIQLMIPHTALGVSTEGYSGSLAVALLSTTTDGAGAIIDSIPPQVGDTIQTPAFISNMLMPLYPFDTPLSNPFTYDDVPPMRWRMPYYGSIDGYRVQIARDAKFTQIVEDWDISESKTDFLFSFLTTTYQPRIPYEDNESYYWRVQLRYERQESSINGYNSGDWSPAMRFKLDSREVGNPTLSTGNLAETTPSFWWDRVEGAAGYVLQVDIDANFSDPVINVKVDGTSYTPLVPLPDSTYFWRVATRRSDKVIGHWTPTMSFVKQSLTPTPLAPINGQIINQQPTFQWTSILTPTEQPRVAASLYRIQIDDDQNFGSVNLEYTTQATTYNLPVNKSLADGTWYWRVAMVEPTRWSAGMTGTYSEPQQFYKEYRKPTATFPLSNTVLTSATSFEWEPMMGAASYAVEIDDDPLFNSPIKATTQNTTYTPVKALTAEQYYWRVRMYDADNNPGPWHDGKVDVQHVNLSLGNYVWLDDNYNGQADGGEKPVPNGVTVELLDGSGASIGQTTRTSNGFYLFSGLNTGEYRVRLAASNFVEGGKLYGYGHSTGAFQESDPNHSGDQNDNGLDVGNPAVDGIMSGKIALTEEEPTGELPTSTNLAGDDGEGTADAHSNLTVDFGVSPASITPTGAHIVFLPVVKR